MNLKGLFSQRKIQGGDILEFERLFMQFYKPLCRYSESITHDMTVSEDIVQDFFFNFWKNRNEIHFKFSMKAYLYQSVRNNSLMYIRREAVKQEYRNSVMELAEGKEPAEDTRSAEYEELRLKVEKTLEKLPVRVAEIFRMNRFEGMKYQEIAEYLHISVKTVEADMGRALQLFRESLKEYRSENV